MGPTKMTENNPASSQVKLPERPRRGSLPDLKAADKAGEKKVPTGPRANPLYKTRLCMNFQSTGSCPYTDKCQFAHGAKELEKWEAWRNAHKIDESKQDGQSESEGSRSRSQSLEKAIQTSAYEGFDFGSPVSGTSYEVSTPVLSSLNSVLDDTPASLRSSFSLWSAQLDELDHRDRPFRPELRGRAATYDSTYDNISQLSDAPTLFPLPPVLPNLGRLSFPQ